jgi:hypothetical protein
MNEWVKSRGDSIDMKKIKEYYQQFYAYQVDNLDEIDQFFKSRIYQKSKKNR